MRRPEVKTDSVEKERGVDAPSPSEPPIDSSTENVIDRIDRLSMPIGFERVMTLQFGDIDEDEEYIELRNSLKFTSSASQLSYGSLQNALDEAEDKAFRAWMLSSRARVSKAEFDIDANIIVGAMRKNAREYLERLKRKHKEASGTAGKSITDADIIAQIVATNPDEWAAIQSKINRAEENVKLYEELHERLAKRAGNLRTMVATARAV